MTVAVGSMSVSSATIPPVSLVATNERISPLEVSRQFWVSGGSAGLSSKVNNGHGWLPLKAVKPSYFDHRDGNVPGPLDCHGTEDMVAKRSAIVAF